MSRGDIKMPRRRWRRHIAGLAVPETINRAMCGLAGAPPIAGPNGLAVARRLRPLPGSRPRAIRDPVARTVSSPDPTALDPPSLTPGPAWRRAHRILRAGAPE